VSAACELTVLFGFVFCPVRAVHKLYCRLFETEHVTNGDQCQAIDAVTESRVL